MGPGAIIAAAAFLLLAKGRGKTNIPECQPLTDKSAHIKWLEGLQVPARIILPNAPYFQDGNVEKRVWWPSYSNSNLKKASQGLSQFVSLIQQCRPTSGKPVMTGHSMGGFVALDFSTQFPQLISSAVPVATTRSSALWGIEPGVPIHGIHGELDSSFGSGKAYYDAMANKGLDVSFTAVPGAPHRLNNANAGTWRTILADLIHCLHGQDAPQCFSGSWG